MIGRMIPRQPPPRAGAVDLRGLEQVFGNQRQPGQQQQRHERGGLPHLGQHDDAQRRDLVGQRRAPVRQQVRQVAGARRPGVEPAIGRDGRHDAIRDEHRRAHDAPADQRAVHHQRQRQAQHELDRHRHHGDRQRHRQRGPPIPVGQNRDVVVQADEGGVVRGGKVVALQAQPHRVADRIARHRQHQRRRGRDERERQAPVAGSQAHAATDPLPSIAFCTCLVSSSAVRSGSMSVKPLQRRGQPDGHRLIVRRGRAHGGVGELLTNDGVHRVLGLELRVGVQRRPHRRQAALHRDVLLVVRAAQAPDGFERFGAVACRAGHGQVQPADRRLGRPAGQHAGVGRETEHLLAGL